MIITGEQQRFFLLDYRYKFTVKCTIKYSNESGDDTVDMLQRWCLLLIDKEVEIFYCLYVPVIYEGTSCLFTVKTELIYLVHGCRGHISLQRKSCRSRLRIEPDAWVLMAM